MKKIITLIITLLLMTTIVYADTYPAIMIIVSIDEENSTIYLEDSDGNNWIMEDILNMQAGYMVSCIMDDNNTDIIFDDVILSIRYEGWKISEE